MIRNVPITKLIWQGCIQLDSSQHLPNFGLLERFGLSWSRACNYLCYSVSYTVFLTTPL